MKEINGHFLFYGSLYLRVIWLAASVMTLTAAYLLYLLGEERPALYGFMALVLLAAAAPVAVMAFKPLVSLDKNGVRRLFFSALRWEDVERAVYTPPHLSWNSAPFVTLHVRPGAPVPRLLGCIAQKTYTLYAKQLPDREGDAFIARINAYRPLENYPFVPSQNRP